MLNVDKLKSEIANGIKTTIVNAIEQMELQRMPTSSSDGDQLAKDIADTFDSLVTDALSEIIANAIDYYVKNINITGTIITAGGPTTQMATISPAPTPVMGGKIPNTFGIS